MRKLVKREEMNNMEYLKFNRYGLNEPSKFFTIGLMTLGLNTAVFSDEVTHTFDGRMGSLEEPVDVTPFLENVQVFQI